MQTSGITRGLAVALCIAAVQAGLATSAQALESVTLSVANGDEDLRDTLLSASLVKAIEDDAEVDTRDVIAAADADYNRLLGALYAKGYYSGVINIYADGREVAQLSPLAPPRSVREVRIAVDPGPAFVFARARIAPLAPETVLPEEFRPGGRARAAVIEDAGRAAVNRWRDIGYARVDVTGQDIVADHARATLSAEIALAPGPQVRLGRLIPTTQSAVRPERLREIAGLPTGEIYAPEKVESAANRLRRTGVFRSVVLSEADRLSAGNVLDIELAVTDEKPRRFGVGIELSSTEGLKLSGFWLHRNLLGGAERLRLEVEVEDIAGNSGGMEGGVDYVLGARLDRPASFGPDTSAFALARIERQDEPNYLSDLARVGIGAQRIFNDNLTVEAGASLEYSQVRDVFGSREFFHLLAPVEATWDYRDDKLDATGGYYLKAEAIPYLGLNGSASGGRMRLDGRAYRSLDADGRFVAAARLQLGSIVGSDIEDTPPDFLFFSGGGGTVRGQPYQSLGVDQGGGDLSGGRSFVGLSGELRAGVTRKISVVAFADAGYIGGESFYDGSGEWHSGAGLGVRYDTGIGPIRLDVAVPTSGDTGGNAQFYIGIGQAF